MPNPGAPIRLSPPTRAALEAQLADLISQAESDHAPYLNSIPVWWDWYDAKPLSKERSDPWPGASNIVVPLIQTFSDAVSARLWGAMHTAKRTWSYTTQREDLRPIVATCDEFINSESRSTFDILLPTYDWAFENTVIGNSVIGIFWRRRIGYRYTGSRNPTPVLIGNGPEVVHIPRENILWERDRSIQESSFVARLCLYTWSDMVAMTTSYGWDEEAVEACRHQSGIEGPAADSLNRKRERDGQSSGTSAYQEPHGVWEIWLDAPLAQLLSNKRGGEFAPEYADLHQPQIPIVIDYHRRAQRILKVRAHPYFFWRWPFLDLYFQKLPGRGASKGLAKALEHMQRSATTLLNQAVDRRTLENSIPFITTSPALRNYRFNPMAPIYIPEVDDLRSSILPLNLTSQPVQDMGLMNFVIAISERVTGISDVNLGRETRLGGHPAPATNTLVQLQEGAKVLSTRLKMARQHLGTAAEWLLSMYQQYELAEGGRLASLLGPEDAERLRQIAISPEAIRFDAYALSETVNPDAERNMALMLTQVNANYYGFVVRNLSLLGDPRVTSIPGVQSAILKAIEAATETYKRVLTASEVDEVDRFIFEMRESRGASAAAFDQFNQFVQDQFRAGAAAPAAGGGPTPPGAANALQQWPVGTPSEESGVVVPVLPRPNGGSY